MHPLLKESPDGFGGRNVASIEKAPHFVPQESGVTCLLKDDSRRIVAFIDVFEEVLDRLDGAAHFHVDVSAVLLHQVRVVGYHPPVVESFPSYQEVVAVVSSPVQRITSDVLQGVVLELLRVTLRTCRESWG